MAAQRDTSTAGMGDMDGMTGRLTQVVAEIDREAGPRPWCTGDGMAAAAAARAPASLRDPLRAVRYDPAAAIDACEGQARRRALRGDRLEVLYEGGRITREELRAGHEIAGVIRWRSGLGLPAVASQLGVAVDSGNGGGDYGEAWLAAMEAEHTRFLPWQAWAAAYQVRAEPRSTLEDLTRLVVVEGLGVRQVSEHLRLGNGRGLPLLRRSLRHYAEAAGWSVTPSPVTA